MKRAWMHFLALLALGFSLKTSYAQDYVVKWSDQKNSPPPAPTYVMESVGTPAPITQIAFDEPQPATAPHVLQGPSCEEPRSRGGWSAGLGLMILQPSFESNPAFSLVTPNIVLGPGIGVNVPIRQYDFSYGMDVAPSVFIGYTWDSGIGVRSNYMQYQNNSIAAAQGTAGPTLVAPGSFLAGSLISLLTGFGPTERAEARSDIQFLIFDFEATYALQTGRWSLLGSAGIRYLNLSQSYRFDVTSTDPGFGIDVFTFYANNNFNGLGPTLSAEGKYRVNDFLQLYANSRGSILFGGGSSTGGFTIAGGPLSLNLESTSHRSDILPIAELELGTEFTQTLGQFNFFARVGFLGQAWFGADNATQGLSTILGSNNGPQSSNLGFYGLSIRTGVSY